MKFLKTRAGNYLLIVVGSVIYGAGVGLFLTPHGIAPGGVTGISIMLNKFTGVTVGAFVMLINLPLLAVAFFKLGKRFFVRTLWATTLSSAAIDYFSSFGAASGELILSALAGGALMAVAVGLIFHAGGTTGGSDIVVKFLRRRYPHIKSGTIFLLIDGAISIASGFVFRDVDMALYALAALTVSSMVLDFVLYGADEAKLIFIFSEKSSEIMAKILGTLDSGASFVTGYGGYSGEKREIIMCALKKQRFSKLSEIVMETDEKAFMVVSSASEIYGSGFMGYGRARL